MNGKFSLELIYCYVTRHRAMITPVSPLRPWLMVLARVTAQFFPKNWMQNANEIRSFQFVLEWELSIGLKFRINVLRKPIDYFRKDSI